jgi:hypothetical protein
VNKTTVVKCPPALVVHADWSVNANKRWMVSAIFKESRYLIDPPELVGDLRTFLYRMQTKARRDGSILLGFDFPIGLPIAYAQKTGIHDFLRLIPNFGHGKWKAFYQVANSAAEISLHRPFYPSQPGGANRQDLLDQLGLSSFDHLLRKCDNAPPLQRKAAPLFWTLGAQQVGKAALSGWREVIVPGLVDPSFDLGVWPFSGSFDTLRTRGKIIITETYPTIFYRKLRLIKRHERFSKRNQTARIMMCTRLVEKVKNWPIELSPLLMANLADGFGSGKTGEDPFDALVGLIGMIACLNGDLPLFEPTEEVILKIEGWILGLNP